MEAAPNVEMPQLSSVFTTKKSVHDKAADLQRGPTPVKRAQAIMKATTAVIDMAVSNYCHKDEVLNIPDRFKPPPTDGRSCKLEKIDALKEAKPPLDQRLVFAAKCHTEFSRGLELDFRYVYLVKEEGSRQYEPSCYFCFTKFRSVGHLQVGTYYHVAGEIRIDRPWHWRSSKDVLGDLFSPVMVNDKTFHIYKRAIRWKCATGIARLLSQIELVCTVSKALCKRKRVTKEDVEALLEPVHEEGDGVVDVSGNKK